MKATFKPYELIFKRPAGTSRGILNTKRTYLLTVEDENLTVIGECPFFKGLSYDNEENYEKKLQWVCENIENGKDFLWTECKEFPSIQFGIEQVFRQLETQKKDLFFETDFYKGTQGIQTNGLIWMGNVDFMKEQIQTKLSQNYKCIKLKIGVNWEEERKVIAKLRSAFPAEQLELRVDANGAFSFEQAKTVLQQLAELQIHSIEQPIKAGQETVMAELCAQTPTPIALDEELIGKISLTQKKETLEKINPQYIILKPALVGGWKGSEQWIQLAEEQNIGWWITSALESNIGLNAIAQWTSTLNNPMPQGLGTGSLFTNNFESFLTVEGQKLFYKKP